MTARKLKKTAGELQADINFRLRVAGHGFSVGLPRPVRKTYLMGRNWDISLPTDLPAACRDAARAIVRVMGNEFECSDYRRDWS